MLLKRRVKGKNKNVSDSGISSQGSSQQLSQSTAFRNPHPGFRVTRAGISEQQSHRSKRGQAYRTSPVKTPQKQVATTSVNSKSNQTPRTPRSRGRRGDGDQSQMICTASVQPHQAYQPAGISTSSRSPLVLASWQPNQWNYSAGSTLSNQSHRVPSSSIRNQGSVTSPKNTQSSQTPQESSARSMRNRGAPTSPASSLSNHSQRTPVRSARNQRTVVSPMSTSSNQTQRPKIRNGRNQESVASIASAQSSQAPQTSPSKRLMNQVQVNSPSNISSDRSHASSPTKTLKSEALTLSPSSLSKTLGSTGLHGQRVMSREDNSPRFDMQTLISKGPMSMFPAQRQGQIAKTFTAMEDNGKRMTFVRTEPQNRERIQPLSNVATLPQKIRQQAPAASLRSRNQKRKKPSVKSRANKKKHSLHYSSDSESVFSTSDGDESVSRESDSDRSDTTEQSVEAVDKTIVKSERGHKDTNSQTKSDQTTFVFRFYSTWVECVRCLKWRVLLNVFDPSTLAEDWTCSMHPEPAAAKAGCGAPEMRVSPEVEHSFVYISFSEGSIVWARVLGYPFWPAMVDRDPDSDTYIELKEDSNASGDDGNPPEVGWYHVTFLDKDVSRHWVNTRDIKPYTGRHEMQAPKRFDRMIKAACDAAEDALKLQLTDRIKRFGFAFRWTGKKNRWVQSHFKDSHELPNGPELRGKRKRKRLSTSNRSSQELDDIKETTTNLVKTADKMIEDLQRDFISYSLQSSQQSSQRRSL